MFFKMTSDSYYKYSFSSLCEKYYSTNQHSLNTATRFLPILTSASPAASSSSTRVSSLSRFIIFLSSQPNPKAKMAATRMMNHNLWRVYEQEYDQNVLEQFRQQFSYYDSVLFWIEGDDEWLELINPGSQILLDDILSRFDVSRTPSIQGTRDVTAGLSDTGMRLRPVDRKSKKLEAFHNA